MKKYLFVVLFAFSQLWAQCVDPIDPYLFYLKGGTGSQVNSDSSAFSLGLGGRYRKGHHGLDLSLSGYEEQFQSETLLTASGSYLYYPIPKKNALVIGLGAGYMEAFGRDRISGRYGSYTNTWSADVMRKVYSREVSTHGKFITADILAGMEIWRRKNIKILAQIEVKVPVMTLYKRGIEQNPSSVGFSIGIGF